MRQSRWSRRRVPAGSARPDLRCKSRPMSRRRLRTELPSFRPDEGESLQALAEQSTDSLLSGALVPEEYPSGGVDLGIELYIDVTQFHEVFCADLLAEQAAVMAVSQRPGSALGFGEPSGAVGWKTLPSWAMISPNDLTIGASGERFMAERAGAVITEVDSSHVAMMSQPQAVTDLIVAALGSLA